MQHASSVQLCLFVLDLVSSNFGFKLEVFRRKVVVVNLDRGTKVLHSISLVTPVGHPTPFLPLPLLPLPTSLQSLIVFGGRIKCYFFSCSRFFSGVSWSLVKLFDSEIHWTSPIFHYIPLPPASRTPSTRFRWWQVRDDAISDDHDDVGWGIDDVFIGGDVINAANLNVDFEDFSGV